MKKKIGELLIQIIPVMIGVYLGFVVSNWSDNNKRKSQSVILIENIISEIESNQEKINRVIDYHKMLRDSSQFYSNSEITKTKTNFFKGTRIVRLTSSAYYTGIQTGIINELPMDQIQALNQLYTFQDSYNEFGDILMSGLINKDFSDTEGEIKKITRYLSVTMTDVVIKETDLLRDYEVVKKKIKN